MPNPNIILSYILFTFPVLIQSQNEDTSYYSVCSPFKCGGISFSFPFSPQSTFGSRPVDCGLPGYQITCDQESLQVSQVPKLMLSSKLYQVKAIFLGESSELSGVNLMTLVDIDLIQDFTTGSCQSLRNLTIPVSGIHNNNSLGLGLPPWTTNLTFIRCPLQLTPSQNFLDQIASNYSCNEGYRLYLWRNTISSQEDPTPRFDSSLTPSDCSLVMVPVSSADMIIMFRNISSSAAGNIEPSQLIKTLGSGFTLQWTSSELCKICEKKSGRCGFDRTEVVCFCQGGGCNSTSNTK